MFDRLKNWLASRKLRERKPTVLGFASAEELRHIKDESEYISGVVDSTEGLLKPEDMERVKALTRKLQDITNRAKSSTDSSE